MDETMRRKAAGKLLIYRDWAVRHYMMLPDGMQYEAIYPMYEVVLSSSTFSSKTRVELGSNEVLFLIVLFCFSANG